jgi:ABC-type transport system substrate-binding protein/ABC-type amino acid transport substrate-binding protein
MLLGLLAACPQPVPTATPVPPAAPAATAAPKPTEVPKPTAAPAVKKIVIASDATWPPMEFVDESKNIVGFDIDLIAAIAKDQKFEYEIKNTAWDGIFAGLEGGAYDAILSSVTINDERKAKYDFSDPYFNADQGIVVRADDTTIKADKDLAGKTVGAQIGTTGAFAVQAISGATLKEYDTADLAILDLVNKNIDAVVVDTPVAADFALNSAQFKGKIKLGGTIVTNEVFGLTVQKGDPKGLLPLFNAGLKNVKASGEYDKIYARWIGAAAAAAPAGLIATETKYAAPNCDYGGEIKSIEALDDSTVKFTLCQPDVAFPSKAAFSAFAIHSSDQLKATGGGGEILDKLIGTGPYMLDKWVKGDSIIYKRNPDYWGNKAKAETLVFRWSKEGAQRLLELEAGTVDGIDNPTPDDFAKIEANKELKLYPREALNIFYIGMSNFKPPFDKEEVRQAVAMGIDRQRIVDNFYPKGSVVASHFTPCAIPGGCEGEEWYKFDPAAAKELLAKAGFPNGFETELSYRDVVRGYLPQPGVVAQDIQAQLKANLNITVKINVMESGAFLDTAKTGELPIHLLGWGADYPDQTNFLDYHFGKGASKQFGNGFKDIWDALDRAATLSDQAARNKIYAEANALIKQHVPMIPVAHGGSATAFKADVTGAHASPLGNENMSVMDPGGRQQFVWMQNAEPISLYCADEEDGESLRACEQVAESLLAYKVGGTDVEPSLAEKYEANADLTEWVFHLRQGVKFHDGSTLDAKDVVMSWAVQWDAANPLHKGRTGTFTYFNALFGQFLNAPPAQ